jgi:hypothetical protein
VLFRYAGLMLPQTEDAGLASLGAHGALSVVSEAHSLQCLALAAVWF